MNFVLILVNSRPILQLIWTAVDGYKLFQLSAPISPGSSGSPVFNMQGEVIGIVRATIEQGQNLNFAIPIDYAIGMMSSRELQSLGTLYEPDEEKGPVVSTSATKAPSEGFPTHWKSLTTGTSKIIKRDGDRLYIETVLPEAQRNAGCFSMADLHGKGDFFTGTVRFSCVCQYTKGLGTLTNRYTSVTTIEITKLSQTRIEGRTIIPPKDSKLDCAKGAYTKPPNEWEDFVWIPE